MDICGILKLHIVLRVKLVFADIAPETYNIDSASIALHITERTKAVTDVDFTGQAVKVKEIREICVRYGRGFIGDAAQTIGMRYDGHPIGSLADMTCLFFYLVKTDASGEGGAVTSNIEGIE